MPKTAMFSAVSTASHTIGTWQKHVLSFWATLPLFLCVTSGWLRTDGMWEENDVTFSLKTDRAIYLTKIPFQLNCKLHENLHVESDSCNCSGVTIFSHENTSQKTLLTLFGDCIFPSGDWKKVLVTSWHRPKRVNFRPCCCPISALPALSVKCMSLTGDKKQKKTSNF